MLQSWVAAITTALFALHGWPVHLITALLAFAEAAVFLGLVLPGETAVFLGGVLASQGNINLVVLVLLVVLAAVLGDSVGYGIGRRFGPAMRRSRAGRWVGPRRWADAEDSVRRRGAAAVVVGRWVGVLRALVPAVAGAAGMPCRKFLIANVAGGVLWAGVVAGLGFAAGAASSQSQGWLGPARMVGGAALAVWFVIELVRERRQHQPPRGATGDVTDHVLLDPEDAPDRILAVAK